MISMRMASMAAARVGAELARTHKEARQYAARLPGA